MSSDESLRQQMAFNESDTLCDEYRGNKLAKSGKVARKCVDCGRDIQEHRSSAVSSHDIMKALEANASEASMVLEHGAGKIYLGGFVAAMNEDFLTQKKINLVVNTAKGLEGQFPKFARKVSEFYPRKEIRCVQLNWVDSEDQVVGFEELMDTIQVMESTLTNGNSILVHCAQGRSRSSTVVVAYMMWKNSVSYEDAICEVQKKRAMAQPNPGFQTQLQAFQERLIR